MSKSAVVRGASKAASVWNKIAMAVKAKGGTDDALDILDSPHGEALVDTIADLLVKAEQKTRKVFPITVDYNRTLDQMIAACACGFNNENITAEHFPITGQGAVQQEIILVDFDRDVESDEAVRELAVLGLEPAKIEHATAFGEKYPDVQREHPIVFLGSVCSGYVPCLVSWGDGRGLDLGGWRGRWLRCYQFAAVRKVLPNPAP